MFELTDEQLKQVIKSVLFVSGEGIELIEFANKFSRTLDEIKALIKELQKELTGQDGIHLITYANKAQLSSNPDYADYISAVLNPIRERALTKAAMQTLAIIAYKQPITRLEIEQIRGVSADYAVQVLLENKMIEIVGRKDVVGKPLLFGTTEEFLKRFDLEKIEDLPDYDALLEQIKLIKEENQNKVSESLYKDHTIQDDEIPGFLQGEANVKRLSSEEIAERRAQEEELKQKLKSIDNVIKESRQIFETKPEEKEELAGSSLSDDELQQMFKKVMEEANQIANDTNIDLA